jgi:5-methyltetrahydrofolate--homocysteine methyltransferase
MRREGACPFIIGERINAQGSRAVKRMLLAGDEEGLVAIARHQVERGADALDVCVAMPELPDDEPERMARLVALLAGAVDVPLAVDSTEPLVIERALSCLPPGRAIVNSINLAGRTRVERLVPAAKAHGAAIVVLCIDDDGMARTRERKLEVARTVYHAVVERHGVSPDTVFIDALTFPLGTGGPESARETIEGLQLIAREMPEIRTVAGISDVSFGLPPAARPFLNAVFLHHCVDAGLDAAIANPAHIVPYADMSADMRGLADAAIVNHSPDALARFLDHVRVHGARL